jgi:hypothetical protein
LTLIYSSCCQRKIGYGIFKEKNKISGGNAEGATPVPIPNTEVKPFRADDTMIVKVMGK